MSSPNETTELSDVMSTCRAMRRLRPDPVPDELLTRLVEAAGYAGSGRNLQRARWIVIRDPEQKHRIADLNRRASHQDARERVDAPVSLPHHDAERQRRMWEAVLWQAEHLHEVPALVAACCIMDHPGQDPNRYAGSVWPGIQNLLLAARSLGLGATPTTFVLRLRDEFENVLGLPERVTAQALIPIGFPMGRFGPVNRLPVEQVMHRDRWSDALPMTPPSTRD
jgi:nitroreductase